MDPPLRILHLEDDAADAELVQGVLEAGGIACEVTRVETQRRLPGGARARTDST